MESDPLTVLVHEPNAGVAPDLAPGPAPVIVVLHGHGDDPASLLERVARLTARQPGPRVRILAPVGPVRTAEGTPAWFVSMPGDRPERAGDTGTLVEAIDRLGATLRPGSTPAGAGLFGYSQGGATALALAFGEIDEPRWRPSVVATIAGWLPSDDDLTWDFAGAVSHTRAVLVHGADDPVVDAQMGRSARRVLERADVSATFTERDGGHALSDAILASALGAFRPEF